VRSTTSKKWEARVSDKAAGKSKHLGYFDSEVEAAKAYDACVPRAGGLAAADSEGSLCRALATPSLTHRHAPRRAARVLFGAAAILNFPDGAAAGAGEAESDEDDTPASAERVQRWQRKGLLYLQPLPADDGTSVVLRGPGARPAPRTRPCLLLRPTPRSAETRNPRARWASPAHGGRPTPRALPPALPSGHAH
jgi:hypothetical protein